jgi:uncharacterized protein YgiM (DUF1202 family)
MRSRLRLQVAAIAIFSLFGWARVSVADQVVVKRNVNLRNNPSSAPPAIRLLKPPETLDLLEPGKTSGYYHVRSTQGEEGWVYGNNVAVVAGSASSSDVPGDTISEAWASGEPAETTFTSPVSSATCGPEGNDPGNAVNRRKNRTDIPSSYHLVTFDAVTDLPRAPNKPQCGDWNDEHTADIARFEGAAITVAGYIVNTIKVQTTSTGESCNCNWKKSAEVDWHIPFVEHPLDLEETAVVVETTPRVRIDHPKWTPGRLAPWVNSNNPVRISGWLMFDPEHCNHFQKYRTTLWEVHPITRIEVFKEGQWVDLDVLP